MDHYTNGLFGSPKSPQGANKPMGQGWIDIHRSQNALINVNSDNHCNVAMIALFVFLLVFQIHVVGYKKSVLKLQKQNSSWGKFRQTSNVCPRDGKSERCWKSTSLHGHVTQRTHNNP